MALIEDVRRSMWHAFTALAGSEKGSVANSRLKVLTNSIGRALGIDKAEELLNTAESEQLTFPEYFNIISPKLLQQSDDNEQPALTQPVSTEIDKTCWQLCEVYFHKNSKLNEAKGLSGDNLFQLWKVFNFLAKVDLDSSEDRLNTATLPLRVDAEEAHRVGGLVRQAVGFNSSEVPLLDPQEEEEGEKFGVDFVQFLLIVSEAAKDLTVDVLSQAISSMREEILNDVIKKGYLEKYGNHVTNWKRRWFRLTANELQYFTTDREREMKGRIEVTDDFKPENLPQRSGHKHFRIKLITSTKSFELAAPDLRCKNEWIAAMQKAADFVKQDGCFQKHELMKRERARKSRRDKIAEELFGKSLMQKQLKSRDEQLKSRDEQLEHELEERQKDRMLLEMREKELEEERLARLGVEAQLAEEAAALEAERLRLKELQEIRILLERLLEEERQAKHDEEVVRNLQARLLLEETEKREQLEILRSDQERLLHQERQEKEGLERHRQEQAQLLEQTQLQLQQLALERQLADAKITEAEEKMQRAELERHAMEERLRLRQMSTSIGLKKTTPLADPQPFATHRGKGAFSDADFVKKDSLSSSENSANDNDRETTDESSPQTTQNDLKE